MTSDVMERTHSEGHLRSLTHQWNEVLYNVTGGQARARVGLKENSSAHELIVMFRTQVALDDLRSERTCRTDLLDALKSVRAKYVVEKFTFEG
jgi:hypothetical protein